MVPKIGLRVEPCIVPDQPSMPIGSLLLLLLFSMRCKTGSPAQISVAGWMVWLQHRRCQTLRHWFGSCCGQKSVRAWC